MPDISLSQAPIAPVSAKPAPSAANTLESNAETKAEQGFSQVLDSQMEKESQAEEARSGTAKRTDEGAAKPENAAASGAPAAADPHANATAEGNTLPPDGNETGATLATPLDALTLLLQGAQKTPEEGQPSGDPASDPLAALAQVPAAVVSEVPVETASATTSVPASANASRPTATAEALSLHGRAKGPWTTGTTGSAELPDAAQSAVAQAVRAAAADGGAAGGEMQPQMPLERFGAEVRAVANAMARPGVDAVLDKPVTPSGTSAPTTAGNAATNSLQVMPQADTAAARAGVATTSIDTPLRHPGWDQALSERVMWVANQKFQGAEIKLSPAHLGPIEVRVQLHQDQAQISFTAQHAPTREALEAALPRLREMFTAGGYAQVDVNVSQHSFADQRQSQGFDGRFGNSARGGEENAGVIDIPTNAGRSNGSAVGAIDLFA